MMPSLWPFRRRREPDPSSRIEPVLAPPVRAVSPPAPVPTDQAPRRRRIAPELVASARVQAAADASPDTTWDLPRPLPGVVPADAPTMAQDYDSAGVAAYGQAGAAREGLGFLGHGYLAELAQRPEYRHITETVAREMTRTWIKLKATGDEDKSDKIDRLAAALDRLRVRDAFRRCAELDGFYGRAHLFLDTGHHDPAELATPLIRAPAKIGRGGLRAIRVVEPTWTYPGSYNAIDPLRPDFYRPASWWMMGKRIHASRLLTFVGREVPDILKPSYGFGGLSMSQMAKPYVDNWLRTRESVSDLLASFAVSGVKTDMGAVLQGEYDPGLIARADFFNAVRDNRGLMLLNRDTEEFFNVSTPLGTVDHLQAQAQEQLGSVSGVPLVVLLGLTPSGLNASSEGEIRTFRDRMQAAREHQFRPNLNVVLDVVQLSEFGEIDPGIGYEFETLHDANEVERATIRKTQADTDAVYIQEGVILPDEARQRLAKEKDSPYPGLDLTAPAPGKPDVGEADGLDDSDDEPAVIVGPDGEAGADDDAERLNAA